MSIKKVLFMRVTILVLCTIIISVLFGCNTKNDKHGKESVSSASIEGDTVNTQTDSAAIEENKPQGTSVLLIKASASVALDHSKQDTNLGTAINMPIRGYTVEEGSTEPVPDKEIFGLYKFDVDGISGDIVSAKIKFYNVKNRKEPYYGSTTIYAVPDNNWEQHEVTWNTMPECGEIVGTFDNPPADCWVVVEITPHIKGNGTYSFMLKSDAGYAYVLLSINGHDSEFYPVLEIEVSGQ